jgi:CRP/FNR family cyclic AMP-dependent transcriptional regulator
MIPQPGPDPHWPPSTLLGGLSEEARAAILRLGTRQGFQDGEALVSEGDRTRHVFLLLKGWFKVLASSHGDHEVLLAVRAGGDLVGELASFDGQPRVATVRAVGECRVRRIGQEQFHAFLATYDDASRLVLRAVGEKLRWSTRRRYEFAACPLEVRVARTLVELARVYGRPIDVGIAIAPPLTQADLASLVGASEPTAHRALAALRKSGVIETRYRGLVIRDLQGLQAMTGLDMVVDLQEPALGLAARADRANPTGPTRHGGIGPG